MRANRWKDYAAPRMLNYKGVRFWIIDEIGRVMVLDKERLTSSRTEAESQRF